MYMKRALNFMIRNLLLYVGIMYMKRQFPFPLENYPLFVK